MIVILLVTVEGLGVPVPGELALVVAAAFSGDGDLSLPRVILASWAGTILGGSGGYWLGRTGGRSLLQRFGPRVGITDQRLQQTKQYFTAHGAKTIIVARFIAVLRILANLVAGITHMPFAFFTFCNAIGGLLWSIAFGLLGYFFGSQWPLLEHYIHRVGILTVCLAVVVVVAIFIWRRHRSSHKGGGRSSGNHR